MTDVSQPGTIDWARRLNMVFCVLCGVFMLMNGLRLMESYQRLESMEYWGGDYMMTCFLVAMPLALAGLLLPMMVVRRWPLLEQKAVVAGYMTAIACYLLLIANTVFVYRSSEHIVSVDNTSTLSSPMLLALPLHDGVTWVPTHYKVSVVVAPDSLTGAGSSKSGDNTAKLVSAEIRYTPREVEHIQYLRQTSRPVAGLRTRSAWATIDAYRAWNSRQRGTPLAVKQAKITTEGVKLPSDMRWDGTFTLSYN